MLVIDNDFHMARKVTNSAKRDVWVYSCSYRKRPQPIGYCSERCAHTSPGDAQRHYLEYLLDEATFDGRWLGVSYQCEISGKWADGFAQLKSTFTIFRLCDDHLNRNALRMPLRLFRIASNRQVAAARYPVTIISEGAITGIEQSPQNRQSRKKIERHRPLHEVKRSRSLGRNLAHECQRAQRPSVAAVSRHSHRAGFSGANRT